MLPTTVEVLKEYENMWTDEYNSSSTKQSYRDSVPLESHIATQAKPYVKKLQRIAKDLVKEVKLAETNENGKRMNKNKRNKTNVRL